MIEVRAMLMHVLVLVRVSRIMLLHLRSIPSMLMLTMHSMLILIHVRLCIRDRLVLISIPRKIRRRREILVFRRRFSHTAREHGGHFSTRLVATLGAAKHA